MIKIVYQQVYNSQMQQLFLDGQKKKQRYIETCDATNVLPRNSLMHTSLKRSMKQQRNHQRHFLFTRIKNT
jgi:hypothetical protein